MSTIILSPFPSVISNPFPYLHMESAFHPQPYFTVTLFPYLSSLMAAPPSPPSSQTTAMINLVQIKLSTSTYLMWKRQFLLMAITFEMVDIVQGTCAAPFPALVSAAGVESSNPTYTAWYLRDQKLLGVLFATLEPEAMSEVLDITIFIGDIKSIPLSLQELIPISET